MRQALPWEFIPIKAGKGRGESVALGVCLNLDGDSPELEIYLLCL